MPKRYPISRCRMRRKMKGGSKFGKRMRSWLSNANDFLKRSGLISALGKEYLKGKNSPLGNVGLQMVGQLGYGKGRRMVRRRRRMVGSSLAPVGSGYKYGRR